MPSIDYSYIADLYDSYVTTSLDVPFYLDQARGCRQVLELMSGTGRVSLPLLEARLPLTCVDSSPAMLSRLRAKAEAKGLQADIREMDVCALELHKRFDLIILPFHSFAEITEPPAQRKALAGIREHLEPDGRFICPLHNPPARLKLIDSVKRIRGKFAGKGGETLVLSSVETRAEVPGVVHGTQFYDIYDKDDRLLQHRQADLCFYLHTPESFEELVEETGYHVKALYGDYNCSTFRPQESQFMIWILEKEVRDKEKHSRSAHKNRSLRARP